MRIVAAMSGGVDSSVAAWLLRRQGHEVIGVFMNNWEEDGVCASEQDWHDVQRVCEAIGIPYYSVSFAQQYRQRVFAHFLEEYRRGRTPNPDVMCNREIKFAALLDLALELGAQKLATGHFAGVERRADGRLHLLRARDENKDQTYFLSALTQEQLSYALFPLKDLLKSEVRALAREAGLPVSEKKDSTGVCFIGERNFRRFLSEYLPAQPGDIYSEQGEKLGRHDGLMYYTLGQRRGLGIGGRGSGEPWFVVDKQLSANRLIVAQGAESARLFSLSGVAEAASWISGAPPMGPGEVFSCLARFRHRQTLQQVAISLNGGELIINYARPQRAVTPGQTAAFYTNDECLGGAVIK